MNSHRLGSCVPSATKLSPQHCCQIRMRLTAAAFHVAQTSQSFERGRTVYGRSDWTLSDSLICGSMPADFRLCCQSQHGGPDATCALKPEVVCCSDICAPLSWQRGLFRFQNMAKLSDHSSEEIEETNYESVTGIQLPEKHITQPFFHSNFNLVQKCADLCLGLIHRAIYEKQWERAAGFMISYLPTLEDSSTARQRMAPEIIWRLGTEILLNHPKSTIDDLNLFYDTMKNTGVKNYLMINLEQVFYLLCNDRIEDACRILMVAESWRYGKLSASQDKLFKLLQAYRALLDYRSWSHKKASAMEEDLDFASQSSTAQEMYGFYKQASTSFQEILKYPGVWDPFVLCYVDLLESSGEKQQVENILREYAYNSRNPTNPNAHVYLYEFLKRNEAPNETLINVLKVLHELVPSHKLMIEFCRLLEKSVSEEHGKLALQVAFDLLDFSGWKEDLKAWKCLEKRLKKTLKCNRKDWVLDVWESRKAWWPTYHFTKFHAKEFKHNQKLAILKGLVAGLLLGRVRKSPGPFCIFDQQMLIFLQCVYLEVKARANHLRG
uniref:TATA-box binding protein associated factor, RNA polymerase I subunit A n=1 Tax=Leptobrachium leishanense TaxID=445787 RepID=A0A8C5PFK9_9ANUR